jgi:hypothetical protein
VVKKTKQEVIEAIKGSLGIISTIAKRLGCESRTAKRLIDKWQETKDALFDEQELVLDLADTGLYDALIKKEQWAIKFVLSTKGQSRGYALTPTIKLDNGEPLNIQFAEASADSLQQADNVEVNNGESETQ